MTKIQYGIILDTLDIAGKWFQIKEPGLDAINNIYYKRRKTPRFSYGDIRRVRLICLSN